MAEALAAGLALDAAKAMTKAVTARVLEDIVPAFVLKDQLIMLENKLSDIKAFLDDLGSAKYVEKSKFVNLWLKKLTDVVYSADELMDDYEYELLRRKIELNNNHPSFRKKCSNFFGVATNPVVFRIRMSRRIHAILSKFDELDNEAIKNGLQKVPLAREAVASTTAGYYVDNAALHKNRKHAAAKGSEFIGRKFDEEKLLQAILNPIDKEVDLPTTAIVGIGGLGKTTLARKLYGHEKVDDHFENTKVWICVSEDFTVDRLLNEMVECLTSTKSDLTNTDAITNKLQQQLKGKKFLLVLDDVWENNQDSWNSFKNALLSIGDLRGCVILITTRSTDVAEKAHALYQHKLLGLSEDEGWDLLQQSVFSETRPYDSSLNDVGRKIVNKCKGVPLAIKAIGGTLQSKKLAYDEWVSVENSELWDSQPEDINHILPSLTLSYNHLNHVFVKQCFAYCAIFPKDSEMEKHHLITLWSAQGFLQDEYATSNSTLTLELVGEKYFNILLNYSFLEEEKNDSDDRVRYKMHDLVHDLAAYVSKKDLLVWKGGVKQADARHLMFDLTKNETPPETFAHKELVTRKLRTISFRNKEPMWNYSFLVCASYMRTLIMADIGLEEVPSIIGKLVHLRYLDLSHNHIVALPESICKLYQLQTLRILGCYYLMELPRGLHRLKNLRHIERTYTLYASRRIQQLTNLQTLPPLELRDGEGWSIDELGPLNQLKGQMKIEGLQNVKTKESAIQAALGKKDKIVKLHLEWNEFRNLTSHVNGDEEDILDGLEPHRNLQSLHVNHFLGVRFPLWMMTMVNLIEVKLIGCRRCLQLPTLGQLPFLRILSLEKFDDLKLVGDEFYQSGSSTNFNASGLHGTVTSEEKVYFRSLRKLNIIYANKLSTWMPPSPMQAATAFPQLEALTIQFCKQLEALPCLQFRSLKHLKLYFVGGTQTFSEIQNCTNLESLSIKNCERLKCIPGGLISLKKLTIERCSSLACIPDGLSSLCDLIIEDCEEIVTLSKSLEECISMESMSIQNCPLIQGPIPDFGRLQGLKNLTLVDSGELMNSCVQWIPNLHRLQDLKIGGFGDEWDFNLTSPQSLRKLTLTIFPDVKYLPQQPPQHLFPSSLEYLMIQGFYDLEELPEWIGDLSSLEVLELVSCQELKYLPSKQAMLRLSKLQCLFICHCPLLEERCVEDDGPEWPKISHIPHMTI